MMTIIVDEEGNLSRTRGDDVGKTDDEEGNEKLTMMSINYTKECALFFYKRS